MEDSSVKGKDQMKIKALPHRVRRFCAFMTGVVFFLSGIFKLLDPVGAGLVMTEYYRFFHVGFLEFSSVPAAVFLALAETVTGAALITGVWRRLAAIAASVLLAFFTLLTLVLVIFNPEMDCGCFGEVIHLTHLQTFLKNLLLCLLAFAAFFPYKEFGNTRRRKYVAFPMVMTGVLAFTAYSLIYIPLVDYTDFKPAVRLAASERRHAPSEEDMYEYVLIYEKDGRQKEFSLENLPDSTWTFVDSKAVLKSGYSAEVLPELSLTDSYGEYCDEIAIEDGVMVISVYDPERIRKSRWENIAGFVRNATAAGFRPLLAVASYPEQFSGILEGRSLPPDVTEVLQANTYYADYKTLISMNRSNGGVTCFDRGYLVRKFSYAGLPDTEELKAMREGDITETLLEFSTSGSITFKGFLLYCFAVMLLL